MNRRRVNPRDLPYAAEGGTYSVVNGALEAEQQATAPASASEPEPVAASSEAPAAETPSARTHGGRPSRTKE
jgi:hypothetical protein